MNIEARTQIPDPKLIQILFKTSIKNDHQPSLLTILYIQIIQRLNYNAILFKKQNSKYSTN